MNCNLLQSFVTVQILTPTVPLAAVQQQEDKQLIFAGHRWRCKAHLL